MIQYLRSHSASLNLFTYAYIKACANIGFGDKYFQGLI